MIKSKKLLYFLIILNIAFLFTFILVFYTKIENVLKYKIKFKAEYKTNPREELYNLVFSENTCNCEFVYRPIKSFDEIPILIDSYLISMLNFDSAFHKINILSEEQKYFYCENNKIPILIIEFEYENKKFYSFNIGNLPSQNFNKKFVKYVIPGTGNNQSTQIFMNNAHNYHFGILEALSVLQGDVFVLIKPNEDILALHNGKGKKINLLTIVNYHLNNKSSYSASYLLQAMAFIKWAKTKYSNTLIAGLSQGGAATLFLSIISNPDVAIVASGHSVLFRDVYYADFKQIIGVPEYAKLFDGKKLYEYIKNSRTKYLFTWGKNEHDYYGIESSEMITLKVLESSKNVKVAIHNGGHIFPVKEIKEFLSQVTN